MYKNLENFTEIFEKKSGLRKIIINSFIHKIHKTHKIIEFATEKCPKFLQQMQTLAPNKRLQFFVLVVVVKCRVGIFI
jgi:F0F1-type ATP synthase delta subunit